MARHRSARQPVTAPAPQHQRPVAVGHHAVVASVVVPRQALVQSARVTAGRGVLARKLGQRVARGLLHRLVGVVGGGGGQGGHRARIADHPQFGGDHPTHVRVLAGQRLAQRQHGVTADAAAQRDMRGDAVVRVARGEIGHQPGRGELAVHAGQPHLRLETCGIVGRRDRRLHQAVEFRLVEGLFGQHRHRAVKQRLRDVRSFLARCDQAKQRLVFGASERVHDLLVRRIRRQRLAQRRDGLVVLAGAKLLEALFEQPGRILGHCGVVDRDERCGNRKQNENHEHARHGKAACRHSDSPFQWFCRVWATATPWAHAVECPMFTRTDPPTEGPRI